MAEAMACVAARDNASWCDAVCRTHGIVGFVDDDAWTSTVRTPPAYPDAVVLRDDIDVDRLLDRVDIGPGCSIKDSFASLDLSPLGFEILFDATWITTKPRRGATVLDWQRVRDERDLDRWRAAFRDDEYVVRRALLDDPTVTVAAGLDGRRVAAGAILHHTDDVTGLACVFGDSGGPNPYVELATFASSLPGLARLVGYERGDDLRRARTAGFETIAPLRVWIMP